MKIIINAVIAKKKAGGGFQIAINFIRAASQDHTVDYYYWISEDLALALRQLSVNLPQHKTLIVPTQPSISTYWHVRKQLRKFESKVAPDLIYSILSPSYFMFKSKEIMRCANAWDVNAKGTLAFKTLPFSVKIRYTLKSFLIRFLMRRTRYFITQSEHGREGICRSVGVHRSSVAVIPNVLPLAYQDVDIIDKDLDFFNIVYVAAPNPHKDIFIVPRVAHYLKKYYGLKNFKFQLTIPFDCESFVSKLQELADELDVSEHIENLGFITQEELMRVYQRANIGFFPSLLETFSATLLEYMKFELPIVASDFSFNSDVSGKAALYFTPNDPKEAALKIACIINDTTMYEKLRSQCRESILPYISYNNHYRQTISFFEYICGL